MAIRLTAGNHVGELNNLPKHNRQQMKGEKK